MVPLEQGTPLYHVVFETISALNLCGSAIPLTKLF